MFVPPFPRETRWKFIQPGILTVSEGQTQKLVAFFHFRQEAFMLRDTSSYTSLFAVVHAAAWTCLFIQIPQVVQRISRRRSRDAARESGFKSSEGLFTDHDIHRAQADSLALYRAFKDCKDEFIAEKLQSAMSILSDALRLYGPDQLFSSYNGGKDADVTMYLLRALIANYSFENGIICRPKFIYFAIDDEFPEVLQHIKDTQTAFALSLVAYSGDIAKGITRHIDDLSASGLKSPAFMLGTRRGDPNSAGQQAFSPSSQWMPAFMSTCLVASSYVVLDLSVFLHARESDSVVFHVQLLQIFRFLCAGLTDSSPYLSGPTPPLHIVVM